MKFKNYGVAAGLFGNVWFIDWRLEYRYYTGMFKPAFYNTGYERSRSEYVSEVLEYLGDTANPVYDTLTMGVYGEGGFNWKEIAQLDIGYFWPWDASGTSILSRHGGPVDREVHLPGDPGDPRLGQLLLRAHRLRPDAHGARATAACSTPTPW